MKFLIWMVALWMTCLCYSPAANSNPIVKNTANLHATISRALAGVNPYTRVGIVIKSMKYGDILYTKNEKSLFVPASTLKLVTAEAALLYLGPNYTFPTRLTTDARNIENGVINGNVYLINSGDPTLTYSDLAELVAALKAHQIHLVTGNIYIDNTAYDTVTTGPGWLWHDKKYCYAAPISASIISHNCLSFRDMPAKNSLGTFNTTDPRVYYANIENGVVTRVRSHTCYIKLDDTENGMVAINDCLTESAGASAVVNDILQYDRSLLQDLFTRNNIQVMGNITSGKCKPLTTQLARHDSKPLRELISDMLKMSDNVIAGSIFKKIGETYTHRPGTWESGSTSVAKILSQQAALDIWHLSLIDGSGLSRYNQITPAQMLRILDFTFHNHNTNYDFISALPVAGVDGTLKRRMRNISWRVRAKTGTMQGVISLAGYAISADKEPIAFVIMINGRNGSIWKYRALEDKIMQYLTHFSRGG